MKAEATSTGEVRYLGVDLHKHYVVIGSVNAQQMVVLPPRRVELDDWPAWARQHLRQSDVLVVEATGNTWMFSDETIAGVLRIEVANASKLPWIGQAKVKTDKAVRSRTTGHQPPAIAPTIRNGSTPVATASGRGVSGGSCERSRPQAKKRMKGRRCCVTWSRTVPRSIGYCASSASSTAPNVSGPSTASATSPLTPASVRR